MNYQRQLVDPRWQRLRLKAFERDNWTCTKCGDHTQELHGHHLYYTKGKKSWQYPLSAITTYCHTCHSQHHAGEKARTKDSVINVQREKSIEKLAALFRLYITNQNFRDAVEKRYHQIITPSKYAA